MGKGEATWPATSVSLISGKHDAVLIDALLTTRDAARIVDWIQAIGKSLTTIYITHGHGDHFFGLNTDPRCVSRTPGPSPRQQSFPKPRAS